MIVWKEKSTTQGWTGPKSSFIVSLRELREISLLVERGDGLSGLYRNFCNISEE